MGLSFITEGAIPFAARPITCNSINDGWFRCCWCTRLSLGSRINAPHGGIIVILATDFSHFLQTLLALVVGTLISALLYGFLKPKVTEMKFKLLKQWMNNRITTSSCQN